MNFRFSTRAVIGCVIVAIGILYPSNKGALADSCESNFRLFYANGMFTSLKAAVHSWEQLWEKMRLSGVDKDLFENEVAAIAYNTDQATLMQVAEVLDQKVADVKESQNFDSGDMFRLFSDVQLAPTLLLALRSRVKNYIHQAISKQRKEDLKKQIDAYRSTLEKGYHALVVSHSQGNFFSNTAYDAVMLTGDYRKYRGVMLLVSVATPAANLADTRFARYEIENEENDKLVLNEVSSALHITLKQDRVVGAIPFKLSPNWDDHNVDGTGHGFIEHYLGSSAKDGLLRLVQNAMEEVSEQGDVAASHRNEFYMGPWVEDGRNLKLARASIYRLLKGMNSRLIPVWHWAHRHIVKPEKLSFGQCLAGMAFLDTLSWEWSCGEQPEDTIKWFDDCPARVLKAREEDLEEGEEGWCISFDGTTHMIRDGRRDARPLLFSKSPECWSKNATQYSASDFYEMLTWNDIAVGKSFISDLVINR